MGDIGVSSTPGGEVGYYVSAHDFEALERARKSLLSARIRRGMADIRSGNHRAYDGKQLLQQISDMGGKIKRPPRDRKKIGE